MPRFALDRFVISVSGPDSEAFLQGMLTQNIESLAPARPLYAGLLTPQGKLIADMLLWRGPDGDVLIEADPARGPGLLARLNMYKLRSQVLIEAANARFAASFSPEPFAGAAADPRFPDGALGWRTLSAPDSSLASGVEIFDALRLNLSVPDLARDAEPEEVFALEALFEELHGVDFHKGCFVGQENVSRMKRRATTRKKFCPIVFESEAPAFGSVLRAGESEVGSVRSGAEGRAIAFLRLDRALEAIDNGAALSAEDKPVRLDPPPWLIMPTRTEGES
jgi:hypothetical protein